MCKTILIQDSWYPWEEYGGFPWEEYGGFPWEEKVPDPETLVYICDPVKFLVEMRLLVGNNKLYGSSIMRGGYE